MTVYRFSYLLGSMLPAACLVLGGCAEDLETAYGRRHGPGAAESVNGTAVLGRMFEGAGHRVASARSLSPRLAERAECIVWFPDDFAPPAPEVCDWFENWLTDRPGRTLIYVGRDYDAEPAYWRKVAEGAPPEQADEIRRRRARAEARNEFSTPGLAEAEECVWFNLQRADRPRQVRSLRGDAEWLRGVDPQGVEIELRTRLLRDPSVETLLESEGDLLVGHVAYLDSQAILVANGSFLLNLPLVNHEHRKLAAKLIAAVGPSPQNVVFLESGPGGPHIGGDDPPVAARSGLGILVTPPYCWVALHCLAAGVVFCLARWPIFGLPRDLPREDTADFGKHIHAVGDLLRRSQDRAYARARLLHYRQKTQ